MPSTPASTRRSRRAQNIANMRRQLRRLGLGHDPRRSVATTDVGFYRWTQWIFLRLYESWYDPRADAARPVIGADRRPRRAARASRPRG